MIFFGVILIMPVNHESKALFLSLPNTPFVGLIHKETKEIVLSPCIAQKVSLTLNEAQEVSEGTFINNNLEPTGRIGGSQLEQVKHLFQQGYLPRLLATSEWNSQSAHELLFEKKCQSTRKYEWGGFAMTLDAEGILNYAFVSGAFNSLSGKRKKGSALSDELIGEVMRKTKDIASGIRESRIIASTAPESSASSDSSSVSMPSPPRKRKQPGFFSSSSSASGRAAADSTYCTP
jgi:hypothetical protein